MSAFVQPGAPPEDLGFDPRRLERLTSAMQWEIDAGRTPGVAMLVVRHGRIACRQTLGALRPGGPAMSDDAIFRIYSMTKPIASVAAMSLVEEGRLSLLDPVSAFIPTFADVKVGVPDSDGLALAPPVRPITVQDLLRHTSGLFYPMGDTPLDALARKVRMLTPGRTAAENADAVAAVPLKHQPGAAWEYSASTDVLGRILEIVEGARLGEVLESRVFAPLGMADTGFFTPSAKRARRADPFSFDLVMADGSGRIDAEAPPTFESGAAGLVSTLADYGRFAAMLAGGGAFEGARILGPRTVAWMTSDHLDAAVDRRHWLLWPGHGFGLGFAVRLTDGLSPMLGSAGEYYWGGMMGTLFWVSPRDDMFAVLMTQSAENRERLSVLFHNLVTAAMV